jgi:outer membrane protein
LIQEKTKIYLRKKMKKLLTALIFTVLVPVSAWAAAEGVYVVDVQKVISTSLAGKAARSNMEAEMKKSEARLMAGKQELERLKEELSKQQAVLSKDALEQKKENLKKKQRDLELSAADEQDKLRRKNNEEIEKVLVEIKKTISDLSDRDNYPVIIEKDPRLVVYANPKLDLTDRVISALDQQTMN